MKIKRDYRRLRRWMRLNTAGALLLAAALTLMANYLAQRHWWRADFSRAAYHTLSPATLELIADAHEPINIIALATPGHELFRDLRGLLREYQHAADHVRTELVDPHRDLARSKELAVRHDFAEPNHLIVEVGDRVRFIALRDLADYDYSPMLQGRGKTISSFRGEQVISTAIHSLLQARRPIVGFIAGHGEKSIDNHDSLQGYSSIARLIRRGNIEVQTVLLDDGARSLAQYDALVIAGPTRRMTLTELDMLRGYLNNAGRLFLLLDQGIDAGLNPLLEEWGVKVGNDRVIGLTLTGGELLVPAYGRHPITARMQNVTTIFNTPCSIQPLAATSAAADRPRVTVLAATTEQGWANKSAYQNPPKFDPKTDQRGPIAVAVAVEKGIAENLEMELKSARMVVFGDSTLATNGALIAGYGSDLFLNSLQWLLEISQPMAIAAKQPPTLQISLPRTRQHLLYVLLGGGIPMVLGMLGLVVLWLRRK
ncbi:MAG: Gldg family protein [Lentisphaerae bacterium]|nr:Gldg family protein [Lentisphaerota bacterium]